MSNYTLAFLTGLFGSIHCLGMCGPLAFAVPSKYTGSWLLVLDKLLYQLGRIISYMLLGILAGIIGKQLWLAGLQQTISILSGLLIIFAACSALFKFSSLKMRLSLPVTRLLHMALKNKFNHLLIGMLNGLLPCGFVSLALAGAINTGSVAGAAGYMLFFGTGTLPLMMAATLGTGWISPVFRRRISKLIPIFMLGLGAWFILRGSAVPAAKAEVKKTGVAVCR